MRMGRLLGTAMAKQVVVSAVLLAALVCRGAQASFGRGSFPDGFIFGTGSASYQYEGAYKEGGKGPSIWDVFSHIPGKVRNNDTGDVADDFYHRFREDVKLLKDMNMDSFRFSIAWTRILPTGSLSGGINKEGVAFYNNLINEGYGTGAHAPGRCSPFVSKTCTPGDSGREPYVVAHHILLAHAEAVRLYRAKYAAAQGGQIGLVAVSHWFVPNRDTPADRRAVQRSLDFMFGWFLDPLVRGEYPGTMRAYLGDRLPRFTPAQAALVKGSYDFVGVNYYTSYFTSDAPPRNAMEMSYDGDIRANTSGYRDGVPVGAPEFVPIFFNSPAGIRELLLYTARRYNNPVIYVTENGIAEENSPRIPLRDALRDGHRIKFHSQHLQFVRHAMRDGVNVKGYFTWTFMDCFEWGDGYLDRFGLIFIDRLNGLKRYRKESSYWIEKFLRK